MIKKILVLTVFIAILSGVQLALASNITVAIGNGSGYPADSNIEIPITLSNVTGFGAIAADIIVDYDASQLSFSSLSVSGTIAQNWGNPTYNSKAAGRIVIALYGTTGLNGQGKLLKLYFNVNASAKISSSTLSLTKAKLSSPTAAIASTLQNGTFTVQGKSQVPQERAQERARFPSERRR